jgi:hypothetical protein
LGFWLRVYDFKIQDLGFEVKGLVRVYDFKIQDLGFEVKGLGLRAQGLEFRV